MATREITKRNGGFSEPVADAELIPGIEEVSPKFARNIARLAALWLNRRLLARFVLVGLVCSTLIAFLIPVRYTSTTRLMPPDSAGGIASVLAALGKGSGSGGDVGMLGSLLGMRTSSDLFVGVLESRTVEDDLIDKFDLRKVYGERRMEDARSDLEGRTDVSSDRKSGIISVKVSDHDASRAAAMAREYVAELNRVVVTLNTSAAHKERIFLEQRLSEVQVDLESSERQFSDFASKHTTIDIKEQGKAMIGAAAQLEGELIAAQTQLQGLRQIYTENNVRVRTLQARINELQLQLQKLGGKAESVDGASLDTEDMYPSIRRLPILGVQYADLYRENKLQEAVFEALTKQYELAKVEEARETPSVKVLDEGNVPSKKSFPPRILVVILGIFLFALIGCGWILGNVRWQEISPGHPGKILANDVIRTMRSARWTASIHVFGQNGNGTSAHTERHSARPENKPRDVS